MARRESVLIGAVTRASVLLGVAASFSVVASGPDQQAPVFKSHTKMLTLAVSAVNDDGRPVLGLTASDFDVSIDGRAWPVRLVEFLDFAGTSTRPKTESPSAVPQTVTNRTEGSLTRARGGRVMVLLFDDLSFKAGEGKGLLVAFERMLASLSPDDLIGLTTTSGGGPVVPPTRDRSAILSALKDRRLMGQIERTPTGEFFVTEREALDVVNRERGWDGLLRRECPGLDAAPMCTDRVMALATSYGRLIVHRTTEQVNAYVGVMAALASAPQPRVLLVLSGGLAWSASLDPKAMFDRLARASAEAGVQFYVLSEEPEPVGATMAGSLSIRVPNEFTTRGAERRNGAYLFDGVVSAASAVGGTAFRVVGQSDRFVARVVQETSGVYRLGIDMDPWPEGNRALRVNVSTKQPGVTVRTVAHVVRPAEPTAKVPARQALEQRLAQGGLAFGVPMSLNAAMRRARAGGANRQLVIEVEAPADVPLPLIAGFALVDPAGKVAQSGLQQVSASPDGTGYRLVFPLQLGSGPHRLRFAMVDGNGSVGSVDRGVPADLPTVDGLAASDILLSWSKGDDPAMPMVVDHLPDEADTLYAMVELYPQRLDRAITVHFEFRRIDDGGAPIQRTVVASMRGDRLAAELAIKTGDLLPGVYSLSARLDGGRDDASHPQAIIRIRVAERGWEHLGPLHR